MSQKPSERITEIYRKQKLETPNFTIEGNFIESILTYLDEEYERNKPCKCVTKGDTITMERKKKTNNNECPFCNPKPVHPLDNIAGNEQKWKEHQYHQQKHYTNDETI